MKISRPTANEYDINSYQNRYIQAVMGDDALKILAENISIVENFFKNIPLEKLHFRYAEGKWSPLEMLGHIVDTEKILLYRALSVARGEKKSLLGFEEDDYVKAANFDKKSLRSLLLQFKAQRKSTILFYKSLRVSLPHNILLRIVSKKLLSSNLTTLIMNSAFVIFTFSPCLICRECPSKESK